MRYEELMKKQKVKSMLIDLTAGEREIYDAFLELAETETDVRILSEAWLRYHASKDS